MNTQITIDPEKKAGMAEFVERIDDAVKALKIVDADSLAKAINVGSGVKKALKKMEGDRKALVQPLNDHVKLLNNGFKIYSEPLKKYEIVVKALIQKYQLEQREIARQKWQEEEDVRLKELAELEEKKKAELAKLDGDIKVEAEQDYEKEKELIEERPNMAAQAENTVHASGGKMTQKRRWTFSVEDKTWVPLEYLIVDEKAVRQAIRDGERTIKGIKIYQELNISL